MTSGTATIAARPRSNHLPSVHTAMMNWGGAVPFQQTVFEKWSTAYHTSFRRRAFQDHRTKHCSVANVFHRRNTSKPCGGRLRQCALLLSDRRSKSPSTPELSVLLALAHLFHLLLLIITLGNYS